MPPLARTTLGQFDVEVQNYAYTLQGWIKGVKGENFSYALGYYAGDYSSIGVNTFDRAVFTKTYKKGTTLEVWAYLDDQGKPIIGDYFTQVGQDPSKLGISLENRVKVTIELTEDTKFLQSTTKTIENWKKPGSGEFFEGGGTQLFNSDAKYSIVKIEQ